MAKVSKRTINEVLNLETGENIEAEEFFKKTLDELSIYRSELQKAIEGYREPLFVCYYCKQKVRIRGGISNTAKRRADVFHFAHLKDSEDCHIKTKNNLSKDEINRIKYNGEKESRLHRTLKEKIAESLRKNEISIGEVSNIEVEKVINNKVVSEWKKPDINAFYLNKRIAIELQLSTTWLDVITRRQHFYKEQQIFILWVFHVFDINDDRRSLAYSDIIYTNNQNAYVFDEETYLMSNKSNDLILKCYYNVYSNCELILCERWDYKYVSLSQLHFDESSYTIYYHDSNKQKEQVLIEIEEQEAKALENHIAEYNIEQKKRKKLETLYSKLESHNLELESATSKRNELSREINNLLIKNDNAESILEEIEKHVKEIVAYLSSSIKHINSIFYEDNLLEKIEEKFKNKMFDISQSNAELSIRNTNLKKRILFIDNYPIVEILGMKYQSLNKKTDWDFINKNYTQIKIIEKSEVHSLFAEVELKTIHSQNELTRLQFSDNKLFLFDFSSERKQLELELLENNKTISNHQFIKDKITKDLERFLTDYAKAKTQSIKSKIIRIKENQSHLDDEIFDFEKKILMINQEISVSK
ncbi:MAG: DUF6035 family protein [Bacteroidales bacterium]|nr:DUF6035 family protein [Bacteroidales bacterium]